MLRLAIFVLQMNNTDLAPRYTLEDLRADNPYTLRDYTACPRLYTDEEFERALAAVEVHGACQCITLKVTPSGVVTGTVRTCDCGEKVMNEEVSK